MADNQIVDNGALTDFTAATDKVTYSGDANVDVQLVRIVNVTGAEGSKTVTDIQTGVQYVEDTALAANAAQGTLVVARRDDALSTLTPAENDAVGLRVGARGALWVQVDTDNGTTPVSISIDQQGTSVGTTTAGDMPHNDPDSGNPVKIGGKVAVTPSSVAVADRVDAWFGQHGQLGVFLAAGPNSGTVLNQIDPASDAQASNSMLSTASFGMAFNGTNWGRIRNVEALSAAPNVDIGIQAVGIGPGYDRKTNPAGVAATSTANAVTVGVNGADMIAFHVTTIGTTPGSMIFETTTDDTAWVTAGMVLKGATGPDLRIDGAFVPAVNDVYLVRTTGMRQVRYRVNAVYASGTATVEVTASAGAALVKALDMGAPPHNFGYVPTGISAQYTTAQTSTTIGPTVSSTQRMCVTSLQIGVGGTVAGTVQVYFGTGAFSRGTSKAIFDHEFAASSTLKPGFFGAPAVPWMGAADEELKITSTNSQNPLTVTIWYYLITA